MAPNLKATTMNNVETDWDEIPEWLNYTAVDRNGDKFGYSLKPSIPEYCFLWVEDPSDCSYMPLESSAQGCPEWRDSLRQRPGHEQ